MPPKKKQRLPVLPGQKTLFSFVGRDGNNNFNHDDSVRKETENMIDDSQDVQVESDSEPDNDDTPHPVPGPSDRDANEKDICKYRPVGENGIKINLQCMTLYSLLTFI
jgi:hypothetical protein